MTCTIDAPLTRLRSFKKYGPIWRASLFGEETIVVADVDAIRALIREGDAVQLNMPGAAMKRCAASRPTLPNPAPRAAASSALAGMPRLCRPYLPSRRTPPRRPCCRRLLPDMAYTHEPAYHRAFRKMAMFSLNGPALSRWGGL